MNLFNLSLTLATGGMSGCEEVIESFPRLNPRDLKVIIRIGEFIQKYFLLRIPDEEHFGILVGVYKTESFS